MVLLLLLSIQKRWIIVIDVVTAVKREEKRKTLQALAIALVVFWPD